MAKEITLQKLVELYVQDPSETLRSQIIVRSVPLVRSIIGKINFPDTPLATYEDLENVAIVGLIQALDSYDANRNIHFSTFAYYRIRGSVVDYMRSIDQLARGDRNNYARVQQAIAQLQQELGRQPEDEEICARLQMEASEYHKLMMSVQQRVALSLQPGGDEVESGDVSEYEVSMAGEREQENEQLEEEYRDRLTQIIGSLPERDRIILTLYYYEDLTLREIALLMKLSEARISQILGKLLIQLKSTLIGKVY